MSVGGVCVSCGVRCVCCGGGGMCECEVWCDECVMCECDVCCGGGGCEYDVGVWHRVLGEDCESWDLNTKMGLGVYT